MHCLRVVILAFAVSCSKVATEWIEKSQTSVAARNQSIASNRNNKIPQQSDALVLYKWEDSGTPSPEWLEYQRERFGSNKPNAITQKPNINSLLPSKTAPSSSTPKPKKQVFQTKSPNAELPQIPNRVKVETTSRREMSYGETAQAEEDAGNENAAEMVEDEEDGEEELQEQADDAPATEQSTNYHLQFPSIQGFFKFLKSIKHNWLKKSGFGIEKKIKLLKTLRDNLLRTIAKQFAILWQPSERQRRRRNKRGLLDESDLNFPPQAALLSLNFLTFAVFLIKLVLQVVNIVKSKHYSFTGFNVNTQPVSKTTLMHLK